MAQASLQATEKTPVQAATGRTSRLFFIDHLRAALVILVVLHHVAVVYGAGAPFYYVEPPFNDPLAFLVLLVFVLFNQAWFMGALFLIAGYFTPGSLIGRGQVLSLRVGLFVSAFLSSFSFSYSARSHPSATGRCRPV
jgi:ABC-type transport system involved in multi-copper enzyme maturation permease subunit